MATFSSILIPAQDGDIKIAGLATVTASAAQTIGTNRIFAINADQDITIVFYNAAQSSIPTPSATNFRIPANTTQTFDMGRQLDTIKVFNNSASAANIFIKFFTRA